MVALSAPDILLWQSSYSAYYWAYCHAPTTIFAARVNMPTATYPANTITFDTVTIGAYTDLAPELLLLIGSAAGLSDYGRQRIHANSSGVVATATTINIGRSSQGVNDGSLNLVDNAYITVLDLRPIWAAPPFIDELANPDSPQTYKDGIIPFNATYAFSPVANAGVDSLKIVATSGDSATFDFDASSSFKTHPSATSSLTYAWVFPGGTPGTATGATVTGVSFPVGARYIKLTVTDSLGNTQSTWRLKAVSYIGDPNLIPKFTITRHRFPTDGQEFQIQVDSPLPFSTYPDGTEILIAERERYGTTVGSLTGYPDAENMVLAGWLQSEDNSGVADKKGFIGRTTLTIVDAAGRLKVLPGFPQVVVRESTPTVWTDMAGANIDRYLYYLGKWHSNAFSRVDFAWSGTLDTYGFSTLGSDGQSLYEQMDKRCQAIAYRLTCNKNGQLAMKPDPLLQPTAAQQSQYSLPTTRTTTVVVPITEADWMNYSYSYTRHPRIHWNWGNAIIVTTVDADSLADIPTAFCVAPGLAPGQGVGQQTSGEQLAVNQAELNVREGNRYAARMNAVTGYFTVQIRPGDVVDPAQMVWVQFSITSTTAGPRGRTYLSERFLPVELNYSYAPQKGLRSLKITLEREVSGTPAVLDPQPQIGQSQIPPTLPPFVQPILIPNTYSPVPPWNGVNQAPTRLIIFDTGASSCHVATSWDPVSTTITYTSVSTGLAGNNIWSCSDPYNYRRYFALQTTGLYRNDDPFGGGSWVLVANNATMFAGGATRIGKFIAMSINRQGYIATISGNVFTYSLDYGATWHNVAIGGAASYQTALAPGEATLFCISPFNNGATGWVYCNIFNVGLYKSTDWGASWSLLVATTTVGADAFVQMPAIPYKRVDGTTDNINDGSQELWSYKSTVGGGNGGEICLSQAGGASGTFTNQWSRFTAGSYFIPATSSTGWNFVPFTYDGKVIMLAGTNNSSKTHLWTAFYGAPLLTQLSTDDFGAVLGAEGDQHSNGYPVHSGAGLFWNRGDTTLRWSLDSGATYVTAAAPGGYSGVSYLEWNLAILNPPP